VLGREGVEASSSSRSFSSFSVALATWPRTPHERIEGGLGMLTVLGVTDLFERSTGGGLR